MEEMHESDVLWPEEDMRQRLLADLAYGGGGPQLQGRRRHYGPGGPHDGGARANAGESTPIAIPSSAAPASRRQYCSQSWTLEFARRDGGDGDDDDKEMVPPHVLVARRLRGRTAFSVCTGQGRTLKGRDLSQVRNSVLRLTGFLEG